MSSNPPMLFEHEEQKGGGNPVGFDREWNTHRLMDSMAVTIWSVNSKRRVSTSR